MTADYTIDAVAALRRAVEFEADFPGWLAAVLATVAASHPDGLDSLISGRPGSWEAQHVDRLADGGQALPDVLAILDDTGQ